MAYKIVSHNTTVSAALLDAISELETLQEECQDIVDNASEGLSETQRIQTLGETADALCSLGVDEPPSSLGERGVSYGESVNKDKRKGASRSVRRDNAVAMLSAAKDEAEEFLESLPDEHEDRDEVQTFIDQIGEVIDTAEGCEFPGMFG